MSETTNLKLFKHDNPSTNEEQFDIENYLNGNWDKIDENVGEVNTNISNIKKEQEAQNTNIEENNSKIVELQTEKAKLETELKEMQEDFYQNSIRGQASGEYIHVEDSSNCRAKIGIGGNSEQETREGYNLLDFNVTQGKKVTVNDDGTITINGQGGFTLAFKQFTAKANTKYYIKWELVSGTVDTSKSNGNSFLNPLDNTNIKQGEFKESVVENDKDINGFWINNMAVFTNAVIKFWANTNKSDFEQYGAMPSLDYPSKIETVGDNLNLLDIDKTTYDLTINLQKEGEYLKGNNVNIIRIGTFNDSRPQIEEKFKSGNYTISYEVEANSNVTILSLFLCVIYEDDTQENVRSGKSYSLEEGTKQKVFWTLNVQKNVKKMGIVSYLSNSCDIIVSKVKIEKGLIATPHSKYGQGSVKVTKYNKNLINIEEVEWGTYYIATGALGTSLNWGTIKVKALGNTKYYLSGNKVSNNTACIVLLDKNKEFIKLVDGYTNTHLINTTSDTCYIGISIPKYIDGSADDTTTIMLEEKEILTSYEEHQEQSYIIPTQQEMLEDDYFDWDNEEEVHVWGNVIVNGTETINKNSNSEFFSITKSMSQFDTSANAIKQSISNYGAGTTLELGSGNTNNKYSFNASTIYLDCYNSNINTVEKLKAQLTENNMKIYAKLATPQRIAFTDEQKAVAKELNNARTYKNVTNITTDSIAILDLDYAKDLETLLNNTQALAVNNASEGV